LTNTVGPVLQVSATAAQWGAQLTGAISATSIDIRLTGLPEIVYLGGASIHTGCQQRRAIPSTGKPQRL
jgi:hypothetical protein